MMKSLYSPFVAFILITAITACQKEVEPNFAIDSASVVEQESQCITSEGQTVLGDYIDIPYSIENLLKAYEVLPPQTKTQIDTQNIKPTHYYIRFYPKSISELDTLRNIKPYVFLSETPLDREVVTGGSYYHDPSIPDDLPTYQYTVIPVERWAKIKNEVPVESEVLIEAFIPDYDEAYSTRSEKTFGIPAAAYNALMQKAYEITGNDISVSTRSDIPWTPRGSIRAYDDSKECMVPVPGVRIRATHLLTVKETLTEQDGSFVLPQFTTKVSYKIVWESDDWDIRDGLLPQATFDGPSSTKSSWHLAIGTEHEKNVRYAATQRALYRCYYLDINGLLRPTFPQKLKVCQRTSNSSNPSMFSDANAMGWHIESWIYNSYGLLRDISLMYLYIMHELGHAAHYSNNSDDYTDYCKSIRESWALFYAVNIYRDEYGEDQNYETYYEGYENQWPNSGHEVYYTPLFVDLVDDFNQSSTDTSGTLPFDVVSGYSCSMLSGILNNGAYSLDILRNRVKANKPDSVTNNQIDMLFDSYARNWDGQTF